MWIDADAAGYGWFVDATPGEDAEFATRKGDGTLEATLKSSAYGSMDLLSVVAHELGHAVGYAHDSGAAYMDETLAAGVRTLAEQPDLVPMAPLAVEAWLTRAFAPGPASVEPWLFENSGDDGKDGADCKRKANARENSLALSIDWQQRHRGFGMPFAHFGAASKAIGQGTTKLSGFDFLTVGR